MRRVRTDNRHMVIIAAALCLLICMVSVLAVREAKAAERYISDVTVVKGDDGENALIDRGYSVVHPYFLDGEKNKSWVGYKTTSVESSAITDITADGVTNIKGKKDSGKDSIMAIYYMSADVNDVSKFTEVIPLANNGATPVLGSDGNIAVFETENGSGYICMIRNNVWENYIESITCATGKTKKVAVKELCKMGCEYYVDANMSADGTFTVIGYTRTNDKSKAITDIIGIDKDKEAPKGYEKIANGSAKALYYTKDTAYGNPLVDIDYMEGFKKMEVSGKQWTSLVITRGDNEITKPYILENDDYKTMAESTDEYMITRVICDDDTDTGIIITCAKDGLKEKQKAKGKLLNVEVKEEEDEAASDEPEAAEGTEPVQYDNAEEAADDENEDVQTDENGEVVSTSEQSVDENDETTEDDTDASTPEDTENEAEQTDDVNADEAGTVLVAGGRVPGMVEMIILIAAVILIPVATIFIKKKIEKGK